MPSPLDDGTALRPGIEPGTAGLEAQPGILTAELGGPARNRTENIRVAAGGVNHFATEPEQVTRESNPAASRFWRPARVPSASPSEPPMGVEPTTSPVPRGCSSTAELRRRSGADRDRTGNLLGANQALSHLSYGPMVVVAGLEPATSCVSSKRSSI